MDGIDGYKGKLSKIGTSRTGPYNGKVTGILLRRKG